MTRLIPLFLLVSILAPSFIFIVWMTVFGNAAYDQYLLDGLACQCRVNALDLLLAVRVVDRRVCRDDRRVSRLHHRECCKAQTDCKQA